MDFKERFKGKTQKVAKDGINQTLLHTQDAQGIEVKQFPEQATIAHMKRPQSDQPAKYMTQNQKNKLHPQQDLNYNSSRSNKLGLMKFDYNQQQADTNYSVKSEMINLNQYGNSNFNNNYQSQSSQLYQQNNNNNYQQNYSSNSNTSEAYDYFQKGYSSTMIIPSNNNNFDHKQQASQNNSNNLQNFLLNFGKENSNNNKAMQISDYNNDEPQTPMSYKSLPINQLQRSRSDQQQNIKKNQKVIFKPNTQESEKFSKIMSNQKYLQENPNTVNNNNNNNNNNIKKQQFLQENNNNSINKQQSSTILRKKGSAVPSVSNENKINQINSSNSKNDNNDRMQNNNNINLSSNNTNPRKRNIKKFQKQNSSIQLSSPSFQNIKHSNQVLENKQYQPQNKNQNNNNNINSNYLNNNNNDISNNASEQYFTNNVSLYQQQQQKRRKSHKIQSEAVNSNYEQQQLEKNNFETEQQQSYISKITEQYYQDIQGIQKNKELYNGNKKYQIFSNKINNINNNNNNSGGNISTNAGSPISSSSRSGYLDNNNVFIKKYLAPVPNISDLQQIKSNDPYQNLQKQLQNNNNSYDFSDSVLLYNNNSTQQQQLQQSSSLSMYSDTNSNLNNNNSVIKPRLSIINNKNNQNQYSNSFSQRGSPTFNIKKQKKLTDMSQNSDNSSININSNQQQQQQKHLQSGNINLNKSLVNDAKSGGFRAKDLDANYSAIHRSAKFILETKNNNSNGLQLQQQQ